MILKKKMPSVVFVQLSVLFLMSSQYLLWLHFSLNSHHKVKSFAGSGQSIRGFEFISVHVQVYCKLECMASVAIGIPNLALMISVFFFLVCSYLSLLF